MSKKLPQDQYVEIGGLKTRYWAAGDGKSSVILLHGLGGYIEHWEDNVAALAQCRRVYALDLVGFARGAYRWPRHRQWLARPGRSAVGG